MPLSQAIYILPIYITGYFAEAIQVKGSVWVEYPNQS